MISPNEGVFNSGEDFAGYPSNVTSTEGMEVGMRGVGGSSIGAAYKANRTAVECGEEKE